MRHLLPLLALPLLMLACEKTGTLEVPTTDDSGAPNGDDSNPGTDDSTVPTDDSSEPEPDPVPDTSIWEGERTVYYGDCAEPLYETGYELGSDWDYYDWAMENCPDCDHIYYIEVSPETVCGIPVTTEIYRGLVLNEPDAEVWTFNSQGAYALDDQASFDGFVVEYAYSNNGVDIEGRLEFPELPQ